MIDREIIIETLDAAFEVSKKLYAEHKERVLKALDWWDKNSYPSKLLGFVSCQAKVNEVTCVCMGVDLRGAPWYICEFRFRPINAHNDAGNGNGNEVKITF